MFRIVNFLNQPLVVLDATKPIFTVVEVNNSYLKFANKNEIDFKEKGFLEVFLDDELNPEFVLQLSTSLDKVVLSLKPDNFIQKYLIINSTTHKIETYYWKIDNTPVLDDTGNLTHIINSILDLTPIENTKNEIKQSIVEADKGKQLLEKAEDISKFGTWEYDLKSQKILWSDGVYKMCGYEPQSFEVNFEKGFNIIHPDDRQKAIEVLENTIKTGVDYNIEKRLQLESGEIKYIISRANLTNDEFGNPDKLFGVFQDITDIKIQQEELIKIQTNQETLINSSTDLIWSIDKNYCLIAANNAWLKLMLTYFGTQVKVGDSVLNNSLGDFEYNKWKTYYQRSFNGETFTVKEQGINQNTFKTDYSTITITPMYSASGDIFGVACYLKDITAETENLIALENTKAELNKIVNSSLDIICTFNDNGDFVNVNASVEKILGFKPEEFIGKNFSDFVSKEDLKKTEEASKAIINGAKVTNFENSFIGKNGSIIPLSWSAQWDEKEKLVFCVARDATELLKANSLLLQQEKYYRTLVENGSDGIVILNLDGTASYVSPSIKQVLGYEENEAVNLNMYELLHPDDVADATLVMELCLSNPGKPIYGKPLRTKHKDGSYRWLEATITNLLHDSDINGIVDNFRDVTDQKIADEEMKLLIDNTEESFILINKELVIVSFNKQFERNYINLFGLEIKKGESILNYAQPDRLEELKAVYSKVLNGDKVEDEIFINDKIFSITYKPAINEAGQLIGIFVTTSDITEKRRLELKKIEAIEQESLFAAIVNSSDDAIISENLDGIITQWNPGAQRILGYYKKEVIGKHISIILPERIKDEETLILQKIKQGEYIEHHETKRKRKDGVEIDISLTVSPIYDVNGRIIGASKTARDITEKKQAEHALKASFIERNVILESIYDAFFSIDKEGVVIYWNNKAEKLLGKNKDEILGKNIWEVFKDASNSIFFKNYHKAIIENETQHFEAYSEVLKGWFEVSAYPSANGLSVYFTDITEKKKTILKLEESEKRYSNLFLHSPQPMCVYDPENYNIIQANLAAFNHYGYSEKELFDMRIFQLLPAEDLEEVTKSINSEDVKGNNYRGIQRHIKKSGEIIDVEIYRNTIVINNKEFRLIAAVDITEKLKYIRAIEDQNKKLQNIAWTQSHIVRAPLARLLGFVDHLNEYQSTNEDYLELMKHFVNSANELDTVIREIVSNSESFNLNNKN
jgi:PAS domain S-box-containing protein